MISKHLETTLNKAIRNAQLRRQQYATVEHLLLALTENPEVTGLLLSCGCDLSEGQILLARSWIRICVCWLVVEEER